MCSIGEPRTESGVTSEERTKVIKHADAAAAVEDSEALTHTKMIEVCALHDAWMMLSDPDTVDISDTSVEGTCYSDHEQIEEAARALVEEVAIRAGRRRLEEWENPCEPLLTANTCRIRLRAQDMHRRRPWGEGVGACTRAHTPRGVDLRARAPQRIHLEADDATRLGSLKAPVLAQAKGRARPETRTPGHRTQSTPWKQVRIPKRTAVAKETPNGKISPRRRVRAHRVTPGTPQRAPATDSSQPCSSLWIAAAPPGGFDHWWRAPRCP